MKALLEKVFLEVQFRSLQRIQDEMTMQVESEITPEEVAKNLRTTERFMRKKEEIDKQIEKSEGDRSGKTTPAVEKGENNDFDVEEYEYQPEEYSYQHVTAVVSGSLVVKPEKPFYIPLTDVPFPGEVSSEFDLKRLLQGDYCLENDLDLEPGKKIPVGKKIVEEKIMFRPEVLDAIRVKKSPKSESPSETSIDSYDERQIKKYMRDHADHVSFGGPIIKTMAKKVKQNLFAVQKERDALIIDETLRQYRMAEYNLKHGRERKVSITLPQASEAHKEIIRRQTGFVRPEDLARIRQFERGDEDNSGSSADDDYQPYTRQVSIQQPHSVPDMKKLKIPRKSGSKQPEEKEIDTKIEPSDEYLDWSSSSSYESYDKRQGDQYYVREGKKPEKMVSHAVGWKSGSTLRRSKGSEIDRDKQRISVLSRLMDDVDADQDQDQGPGPTLKDYIPASEHQKNKSVFLLTYSPEKYQKLKNLSDDSREAYLRRRHPITMDSAHHTEKPIEQILLLQHGKKVYRKISTDYVKTIDHIEKKEQTSLRSLEYARKRPAMSVMDYKKKNKEYQENLAKKVEDFH